MACSDYVWDGKMLSKLMCSFDDSLLPGYCISSFPHNSLIHFFGSIKDVTSSGGMTIDIKSIVTNMDHVSNLGKCKSSATADNIGLEMEHVIKDEDRKFTNTLVESHALSLQRGISRMFAICHQQQ
ncbi:hypothetical protein EDC04DRAFT_2607915 [Pisolithus marmoratus]|nr:hypothetical protein EDC04DRAFT_2607915 [Pisolithus marmoratus]